MSTESARLKNTSVRPSGLAKVKHCTERAGPSCEICRTCKTSRDGKVVRMITAVLRHNHTTLTGGPSESEALEGLKEHLGVFQA